jgi:hypothetical protein
MSKIPDNLFAFPGVATATMKREDIQAELLRLGGWVMVKGRMWDICVEDIGAGVCKVSLKRQWQEVPDPLPAIIKQLKACGFECEAGPLEMNTAFIELERLASK